MSPFPSNPLGHKHLKNPSKLRQLALVAQTLGLEHSLMSKHSPLAVNVENPGGQVQLKFPNVFTQTAAAEHGFRVHSSISGVC